MQPATKMLYALSMTGSHDATVPVRRKNPFTDQFVDIHLPVLTDAETAETRRVLAHYGAVKDRGRHLLQLSDGTAIETMAGVERDGEPGRWTVSFGEYLQRLSREVMKFLFDLCTAGNFILDGPDVGVVTSEAVMDRHRDDGFAIARSPEEMEVLLKQGMSAYKKHIESESAR
jgi:hypothetical protein